MSDSHQYENLIDESTPSNTPGEEEHNPRDDIALNTETKYDEDVAILTEMGFNIISTVRHQARIVYRIVVSFAERNRKIITIM